MEQHAAIFARLGHEVTVLTGAGVSETAGVRVEILPCLQKTHPARAAADAELVSAVPGTQFQKLVAECELALAPFLEQADRVFVHNVLTMPFHLACTVALWNLADRLPAGRMVNWVHDAAAALPDYTVPQSWPWNLLRQHHSAMRAVAVSEWMADVYKSVTGVREVTVLVNGIEPLSMLNLTPSVKSFVAEHGLLEADCVLFQPARILRRKNIELGFEVISELKSRGLRAKLVVSGAVDEHNQASKQYYTELADLRHRRNLESDILFASAFFPVTKADLLALYAVTDVVWFPSQREGFGLPLLEGALQRLVVFCADAPPMNAFDLPNLRFFPPSAPASQVTTLLLQTIEENNSLIYARKSVIRRFGWAALIAQLEALLTD